MTKLDRKIITLLTLEGTPPDEIKAELACVKVCIDLREEANDTCTDRVCQSIRRVLNLKKEKEQ